MKEFKATKTMTKAYLGDVLKANAKAEGLDKSLTDRVSYTLAHFNDKDTTRNELVKLCKELATALGDKFVQPPVPEKPQTEKSGDKTDKVSDFMATASVFPKELTIDGATFNLVNGEVTMKDLTSMDYEYEFAFWWTKRHLRQFDYFQRKLGQPKEFPNDLDTCQLVYINETVENPRIVFVVSDTTEAPYYILAEDLLEEDGVRIAGGLEYAIYRKPVEKSST